MSSKWPSRGYDIQDELEDPIAFAALSIPDVMYYEQAMKEPDSGKFEQAMVDEVEIAVPSSSPLLLPPDEPQRFHSQRTQ
jgi:hypothetical protein